MLAQEIAIDAGTANTLVVAGKRGIVHHEPSVVAFDRRTRSVVAVGTRANDMLGKEPDHIVAVHPFRSGTVADLEGALALFRFFLRGSGRGRLVKPKVLLNAASTGTQVQRRALSDLAFEAGAGEVRLLDESIAAAIGAGLPVTSPVGTLIVNVGAGRSSVAVISLGATVVAQVTDAAGQAMDEAISRHIRSVYSLLIGERTAERIKLQLGEAAGQRTPIAVSGRHLATGLPCRVQVHPDEILEVFADIFARLELAVRQVLERTPPELLADIALSGITLTGGGSLTYGLAERLGRATGLPVRMPDDPARAAAGGAQRVLERRVRPDLTQIVRR